MVKRQNRAPTPHFGDIKYRYPRKNTPLYSESIKIGEVAKAVGMPIVSVRFYEIEKLIHPIKTPGKQTGHRRFRPAVIGELEFIRTCREAGLSLPEIKSIMKLFRGFKPPAKPLMSAILRTIDTIRERTKRLEEVERVLVLRMSDPESDIEKLIEDDTEILRLRGYKKSKLDSTIKIDPHRK
jgi:DNA-binding transcriptional MerR regulator